MKKSGPPEPVKTRALALAIGITILQILLALSQGPHGTADSYSRLCAWDCAWYEQIVENGYSSAIPPVPQQPRVSNVAFFPGYPLSGRLLHLTLGIDGKLALLLVAQIFAVLFWYALWLFLRHLKIPLAPRVLVLLTVLAHPASFFLIAGYSESLFLSALLLFAMYSSGPSTGKGHQGAIGGMIMSATRIIGIPLATLPLANQVFRAAFHRKLPRRKAVLRALSVFLIAASGALSFFIYCELRFDRYDLYMETQRIGWGIIPDYGALWKWGRFKYRFSIDEITAFSSAVAALMFFGLETALVMLKRQTGLLRRVPLYFTAGLIFLVTLSGLKSVQFQSLIRYSLPWFILLLICAAHLYSRLPKVTRGVRIAIGALLLSCDLLLLFQVQLPHVRDFLLGRWFA